MKIVRIWFDKSYIYGADESGKEYRQSLLWYPHLLSANDEQRMNYKIGFDGVHWRELDEDISFESFEYEDAEPTPLQKFFLTPSSKSKWVKKRAKAQKSSSALILQSIGITYLRKL